MSSQLPTSNTAASVRRRRELVELAVALTALLFIALHVAALFTESVSWDEFGLFARAGILGRTGVINGETRAGAAEILLIPFVRGCRDAIEVVRTARLLWTGLTVLAIAGLYRLIRELSSERAVPAAGAAAGVACLTLAPAFLRSSIQVRTDQVALLCGLWGALLLARSRRHPWGAPAAGLLFGIGYLFTPRTLYIAILASIVAVWRIAFEPGARRGRAIRNSLLAMIAAAGVFGTVLLSFRLGGAPFLRFAPPTSVAGRLDAFDYYRRAYGYSIYRGMAPTLLPQLGLVALLALATVRAVRRRELPGRLVLAGSLLAAGALVAIVHAGAFVHFWMTLGLFPAVAIGVAFEDAIGIVPAAWRRTVLALLAIVLVVPGLGFAASLLADSQAVQRDSLAFIDRNFAPSAAGFQAEGALFCRAEPRPFEPMFRYDVLARFSGEGGERAALEMAHEFVAKPVEFLVGTGVMNAFPLPLRQLWSANYQPYFGPVLVAGRHLDGAAGERQELPVLVPGRYRFLAPESVPPMRLRIAGSELAPDGTIELAAGPVSVEYLTAVEKGVLVLALAEPPRRSNAPFYALASRREADSFAP